MRSRGRDPRRRRGVLDLLNVADKAYTGLAVIVLILLVVATGFYWLLRLAFGLIS